MVPASERRGGLRQRPTNERAMEHINIFSIKSSRDLWSAVVGTHFEMATVEDRHRWKLQILDNFLWRCTSMSS